MKYLLVGMLVVAWGLVSYLAGRDMLSCHKIDVYQNAVVTCDGRTIGGWQKPDVVQHEYIYYR